MFLSALIAVFLFGNAVVAQVQNSEGLREGPEVLIHYWHFNDQVIEGEEEDYLVISDFSLVGQGEITYPGTGDGYVDFRSHRPADPVSNFNLRMDQDPDQGAVLRVRNPADTRELIIAAPSTGFEDLVVTFATTRTSNGAQEQEFYFTPDAGDTWIMVGEAYDIPELDPEIDDFGYLHKVIDLSDFEEVNNNADLHFKILFVGEGADNTSGNNRFDNFTVDGNLIETDLPASKLIITSVNDDAPVYANESFSITINVLNDDDIPTAVEADTEITLSLETGNGTLNGNLTGVIAEGDMSLVIEDVLYDLAETGVSIRAEADGLETAVSDPFEVHLRTYGLTLESFPPGAGVLTGGGDYAAGAEVTVAAVAGDDYAFNNWSLGDEVISEDAEFVFTMPAEDVTLTANFTMLGDVLLMHYWHFNNQEMVDEEDYLVISDFSLVGQGEITYPGEGGAMDFRSHRESDPVSNYNLRLGQEPDQGAVLRARNPAITRELIFAVPSTDFTDLLVTFATTRTENGSQEQQFYFSPDAGDTWVAVGDAYEIPFMEDEQGIYLHKEIDLSEFDAVNDNPDLHFKILFVGEGNDNPSGNNRFDNFTVDGIALSDDVNVSDLVLEATMNVYPNPASGMFQIEVGQPGMLIRIYDLNGRMVMQRAMSGTSMNLDATALPAGLYLIRGVLPTENVSVTKRLLIQ